MQRRLWESFVIHPVEEKVVKLCLNWVIDVDLHGFKVNYHPQKLELV